MISLLYPSISYLNNSPSCRKQKQNCEIFYLFRLYLIIIIKDYTKYPATTNVRGIHLVPTMSRSIPVPYGVCRSSRACNPSSACSTTSQLDRLPDRTPPFVALDRLPGMQQPPRAMAAASDRSTPYHNRPAGVHDHQDLTD